MQTLFPQPQLLRGVKAGVTGIWGLLVTPHLHCFKACLEELQEDG